MGKQKYGVQMPSTLERSPEKAQRTYAATLKSAQASYGEGERAGRAAYASVKHSFEKVGDHWEPKARRGPSDAQAAKSGQQARESRQPTAGGVNARGQTRAALYERAKALDVPGRSRMRKEDLARAVARRER